MVLNEEADRTISHSILEVSIYEPYTVDHLVLMPTSYLVSNGAAVRLQKQINDADLTRMSR